MGHCVIACYRPKPGKAKELKELVKDHLPALAKEGLVTDRPSIIMEAADGTIVEVFEWKFEAATQAAHTNKAVLAMWDQFGKVCDFVPVATVPGTDQLFTGFAPLN